MLGRHVCVCLKNIMVLVDFSPQESREIFGNHGRLNYFLGLFQTFFQAMNGCGENGHFFSI